MAWVLQRTTILGYCKDYHNPPAMAVLRDSVQKCGAMGRRWCAHGEAGRLWRDDMRLVQSTTSISNGFRSTTCGGDGVLACGTRVRGMCARVCACARSRACVRVGLCVWDVACGIACVDCVGARCVCDTALHRQQGPNREGRTTGFSGTPWRQQSSVRTSSALQRQCRTDCVAYVRWTIRRYTVGRSAAGSPQEERRRRP